MTLEQEFQKQWESLSNYIKSEILKEKDGTVDSKRIQSIFESQKKRWFLPGEYNNAWFEKLKRKNLEVAKRFEDTLKNLQIGQTSEIKNNSKWIFVGTTVIGAIVGFGVSKLITIVKIFTMLWIIAGAVVGVSIGNIMSSKMKDDALSKICLFYDKQLKDAGEILSQIVSQTE